MKNFFSKPKLAISVFAIIALVGGFYLYRHTAVAPQVSSVTQTTTPAPIASGSDIDLSFPKSGRVDTVTVHEGDVVRKGQVLATLSAPDAAGAVSQAKGALDLARAQYASLDSQYSTTKTQQDQLVQNAYRTLLSNGLAGQADKQTGNSLVVTGTYTCDKEGSYILKPYVSNDIDSGYSLQYSGLESGVTSVKYDSPVALGTCGLQIRFTHTAPFDSSVTWTIAIPNTQSASYVANKNAYDLAVTTREKTLNDLATNIGTGGSTGGTNGHSGGQSVAQAQISAAEGAYEAALGAYQSNVISAPVDGTVTFIDTDLKSGQAVTANKAVISVTAQ